MTSTSTELIAVSGRGSRKAAVKAVDVHFLLCGTHGALQQFLEARHSFEGLAGVVEHVQTGHRSIGAGRQRRCGGI